MAAGKISIQANDGKVAGVVFEDGASSNVTVTVPKEGGVVATEAYADTKMSKAGDETITGVKTFIGTELDEALIKECIASFKYPTEEELAQQELEAKIAEAKTYLASTDFKMTVDYYATLTVEQQEELTMMRAAARGFLKEQGL